MKLLSFQTAMRLIYPAQCLCCGDIVHSDFGLCGECWQDTPFIDGAACVQCSAPLLGPQIDQTDLCESCHASGRPWRQGRAVLHYSGNAKKLVLGLKHGDRTDIAPPVGRWMAQNVSDIVTPDTIVLPIPLHWSRAAQRKYNQASLLATSMAKALNIRALYNVLERTKPTRPLEHIGTQERYDRLLNAIRVKLGKEGLVEGKSILLVDDVMTSGATFDAATRACLNAGAKKIDVVVLARAAKGG